MPFRLEGGGGEISTDVKRQDLYFGFYVYVDRGIRVGRWRGRCSGLSLDEHEWEAGAGCGKAESLEPRVRICTAGVQDTAERKPETRVRDGM